MKALYARGGDNPYAVEYEAEQKKKIEESLNKEGQVLTDKYASEEAKDDKKGGFMAKAKSFSF
jgi:hypothetical protein